MFPADARRTIGTTGLGLGALGFGGASVGNLHRPVPAEVAARAIAAAYEAGIRYFDTAPLYGAGLGERRIGNVLRGVPRGDIVVSTKVGHRIVTSGESVTFDYGYDSTMRSIEESARRIGIGSIDIAFIHDIDPYNHGENQPRIFREALEGSWRALSDLRRAGALRAIGVGVNSVAVCEDCLRAMDLDCFLLAGRYTLLDTSALDTLLPACVARGVSVILGAPFNSGLLARGAASGATYNYLPPPDDVRKRVAAIETFSVARGVDLMALALQFPLAHSAIVSVLPGMRSAEQVFACVQAMQTRIPAALWDELRAAGVIDQRAPIPTEGERR
jgi:D-threo-aldose 1-dehydrogenase